MLEFETDSVKSDKEKMKRGLCSISNKTWSLFNLWFEKSDKEKMKHDLCSILGLKECLRKNETRSPFNHKWNLTSIQLLDWGEWQRKNKTWSQFNLWFEKSDKKIKRDICKSLVWEEWQRKMKRDISSIFDIKHDKLPHWLPNHNFL